MATVQERREVSGFDEVRLEGSGVILLQQGESDGLIIECEEDLLPKLKSEVKDGRLGLGFEHWYDQIFNIAHSTITYHVTMREVRGVMISGSGKLRAGRIETDRLRLKVSGAGDLNVEEVHTGDLELNFSGSGKASLRGESANVEVRISGSGDLRGAELDCQTARVHISGSGEVILKVSQKLDVHISGSGDVRYIGQPAVSPHISGSGKVRQVQVNEQ